MRGIDPENRLIHLSVFLGKDQLFEGGMYGKKITKLYCELSEHHQEAQ